MDQARQAGITIPIIPGIKPLRKMSQLTVIPKTFKVDLPKELTDEALLCKTDEDIKRLGVAWCVKQCRELMASGVPSLHFYALGAVDSVKEIASQIY